MVSCFITGAPRKTGDDKIAEVVARTLEPVSDDATDWSRRLMVRATSVSATTVHRIWGAFGLQPHRVETFRLSNDPDFVDKVCDTIVLYLDPSERALVLCVDEKSQIRALDRTQPMLPMRPAGQSGACTITSAVAPPRCSLPSTPPPPQSSEVV